MEDFLKYLGWSPEEEDKLSILGKKSALTPEQEQEMQRMLAKSGPEDLDKAQERLHAQPTFDTEQSFKASQNPRGLDMSTPGGLPGLQKGEPFSSWYGDNVEGNRYSIPNIDIVDTSSVQDSEPSEANSNTQRSSTKKSTTTKAGPAAITPDSGESSSNSPNAESLLEKLYGSRLSDSAMQQAIADRNKKQLWANMGAASEELIQGLSKGGHQADTKFFDKLSEQGSQGISDILTGRKSVQEKIESGIKLQDFNDKVMQNDPKSALSKAARDMGATMGVKTTPDMTYAAIVKLEPMIIAKLKMQEMKRNTEERDQLKKDSAAEKRFDALNKTLVAELQRKNTGLGGPVEVRQRADRILTLMDQEVMLQEEKLGRPLTEEEKMKAYDTMVTSQIAEVATSLDAMLSGGTGAVGRFKELLPKGFAGDFSKASSYLSSRPKGANMGHWVKLFRDTVLRERAKAVEQENAAKRKILSSYRDLAKNYPGTWNDIMVGHNLQDPFKDDTSEVKQEPTSKTRVQYPGAPKIGTIESNHKYLGGDPSDEKNWELVE